MFHFKQIFFLSFFLLLSPFIFSQNQANIWKCGANMGLDFNTTPPTPISGQTNNVDNSSSISDASGNLLFYTNGSSVWNKNNILMSNGSGLTSHFSAGQCALIVPIVSTSKYVIFSNTEFATPGQLHYTVVDMSLNSGLGDVVVGQKNISLGTGWTEKLCAIYTCNYYWVLMHKWNNNQFVVLKVDASGVTTTSVTTNIGSSNNCGSYGGAHDAMGQMTISKDGQKVVNALTCQDKFELFDFDINTGVLSNSISIPGNGGNAWGTGFSADSKKLYVNSIFGSQVFQYDLSTYNTAAIVSSKVSLYNTGAGGYNFGYMELGPDNKMYIPRPSSSYFSVINTPNNLGAAAGFSYSGLSVSPYTTTHGISRIAYNIGTSSGSGTISTTSSNSNVLCFGASTASAAVVASGSGPYNYLWSPGNYTTSTVNNLSAGVYSVSVSDGGCNTTTVSINVVQPTAIASTLTTLTSSICVGQSAVLNAINSGGIATYTVNWSNGSFSASSISVNPVSTSVYSYTVTDSNLCTKTSSISIVVNPLPTLGINTQNICSGITTTLIASGASSYNWLPGNNVGSANVVTLTTPEVYTVTGTSSLNCSTTSTFNIVVNQSPTISVNSGSICAGQTTTLNAVSTNGTYTWSPGGQVTSSLVVSPNVTTNYSVSSAINSCSSTAIGSIIVYQKPTLNTATTVVTCIGQSSTLSVSGANTYTWLPGNSNGNSLLILPVSPEQFTVQGTSLNGCVNSQIINVNTANSLTVNVNPVVICEGQSVTLLANTNGNQFQWKPSTLVQSPTSNSTIAYPISTTVFTFETSDNGFCSTTATTTVIVNDKPNIFAGKDTVINIGESVVLTGNSNYDFGWKTFDGSSLSCNYCSSVSVSPQQSTCYLLESVTSQGCKSQDTLCVTVTKDWSIYIPNAFTPNNDLTNDLFLPYGYGIVDYELYIFDRWGEQIFKSDADHRGWNGFYKNEICEMGVYTYMLIINTYSKKEEKKIGHVTLLK